MPKVTLPKIPTIGPGGIGESDNPDTRTIMRAPTERERAWDSTETLRNILSKISSVVYGDKPEDQMMSAAMPGMFGIAKVLPFEAKPPNMGFKSELQTLLNKIRPETISQTTTDTNTEYQRLLQRLNREPSLSVKPQHPTAIRWKSMVDELDNSSASDNEYRDILSTASKNALKKGETWRAKVLQYIDTLNERFNQD